MHNATVAHCMLEVAKAEICKQKLIVAYATFCTMQTPDFAALYKAMDVAVADVHEILLASEYYEGSAAFDRLGAAWEDYEINPDKLAYPARAAAVIAAIADAIDHENAWLAEV